MNELHCKFLNKFILKKWDELMSVDTYCYSCGKKAGIEILKWRILYWKAVWKEEIEECPACSSKVESKSNQLGILWDQEESMLEQLKEEEPCVSPCPAHCKTVKCVECKEEVLEKEANSSEDEWICDTCFKTEAEKR